MNITTPFLTGKEAQKQQRWVLIDAKGMVLGRLASRVAHIIMGKHRATYTRHLNDGDRVIVINAKEVRLTGNKWEQKIYYRHSGYVGSLKQTAYKDLLKKKPTFIIEKAVKGMLPKNRLGRELFSKNLRVYADASHSHEAQNPEVIQL